MDGSAAMEGGGFPCRRGSLFFMFFFTLKFSPIKFVQPLGGIVQISAFMFFLHLN
jgi:hypothetical protein